MMLALMMHKKDHTPHDLHLLVQAPYFDAHLIRQKVTEPQHVRGTPNISELSDQELLPAGTPVRSNSIARSTRQAFEEALGYQLPTVTQEEYNSFMKSQKLRNLLIRRPELQSDPAIGELYTLLKVAAALGFHVGWCEF